MKPRNIVVLVVDSLRYDALTGAGADGGLPEVTRRSVRFTQARSAGCWTLPATASLFTGLMPHEHGADAQSRQLRKDVPTLAALLKERGYTTRQITANIATTDIFGLQRGFDEVLRVWQHVPVAYQKIHELLVLVGKPRLRRMILSPRFVAGQLAEDLDASKVWLQDTFEEIFDLARSRLAADAGRGRPNFLFLNLMECHFPYHVGPQFETTSSGLWGRIREIVGLFHLVNQTWLTRGAQPIAPDVLATLKRRQHLAWRRIAPRIDAFVRELHDQGNLVVLCADHGDNFGEQDWVYHFSNVTDAGNRVPLYWLSPDGEGAGRRVDMPISARDLFHGLLLEAGDARGAFHPIREPERSLPVMQSAWYDNQGKTLPRFKVNQICFLEGGARWLRNGGRWYRADPTADGPEPVFEPLPAGYDPLEEGVIAPERRAEVRRILSEFEAYSSQITPSA